ncbi:hypothetical protein SAMN04487949_1184 [Halogranum gelatinilyticum]|uniref:Uncharacterized protein n=1 Tax=Halogranum gelatinilyticum TaxID=660521 RepID=A0A1G9R547_9EURY|nr:hypothetical protein [Halogranum gelatinilyticum]SDM18358.1 hypothetical protein SAMN04487949_1184 [Halogranum gelatinilyticum]
MRSRIRGSSTALGYVMTLSITAVLISGLLISTGGVVEDQRDSVARDELDVAGQRLAATLMSADRLAASGGEDVRVQIQLFDSVVGSQYFVEVDSSASELVLRSDAGVTVRVRYVTSLDVVIDGPVAGEMVVELSDDGSTLEVRPA